MEKQQYYYTFEGDECCYHPLGEYECWEDASKDAPPEEGIALWCGEDQYPVVCYIDGDWRLL